MPLPGLGYNGRRGPYDFGVPGISGSDDSAKTNSAQAEERDLSGGRIGKYRLIRFLGRGAAGTVYLAEDTRLGRQVALKLLSASTSGERAALERFILEARSAARLDHPNVVRVYETDERDGYNYIAMEWLEGGSAQSAIDEHGPLNWRDATRWIVDACRGLEAAHRARMLHRDVKPGNLLRAADGSIKVGDFGLVKLMGHATPMLTALGSPIGTPSFMSPEQCRGEAVDHRSDIYSLGATYYALLTGKPPFTSETSFGVMFAHCANPIPDPRNVAADVPESVSAIIAKAMAKPPAERFRSSEEMQKALEAVLAESASPIAERPIAASARPRSSPARWVAALAGAACLLVVLVVAFVRSRSNPWGPSKTTPAASTPNLPTAPVAKPPPEVSFARITNIANYKMPIADLVFAADGDRIVSAGRHGIAMIHELSRSSTPPVVLDPGKSDRRDIYAVAYAPRQNRVVTAGIGDIRVWNLATQKVEQSVPQPHQIVRAMVLSPDSRSLATSGDLGVHLWEVGDDGRLSSRMALATDMPLVTTLSYANHDDWVLAGAANGLLMVWQTTDGKGVRVGQIPDVQYSAIAFGKTRMEMILARSDGRIYHDSLTPRLPDLGVVATLRDKTRSMDYSPNRRLVAAAEGDGDRILFLNLENKKLTWLSTGVQSPILVVRFGPNGREVAAGSQAGHVLLAEIPDDLLPPETPRTEIGIDRTQWILKSTMSRVEDFLKPLKTEKSKQQSSSAPARDR